MLYEVITGHTCTQFRVSELSDEWMPMDRLLDMPGHEYAALYAAIQARNNFV